MLSKFNPGMQTRYCRDLERAYFGKAPTLAMLSEAWGRNAAEAWMEIQLNDLSEFAGCKEKLGRRQIADLAVMIIEGYPHFKLTEFMHFFQRFKRCDYGKFYGAVDPMVILQALATFAEDRRRIFDDRRRAEERAKEAEARRANEQLKARYKARVPGAFTDKAAISFLQYRLMGYDGMTDAELTTEIEALTSGAKTIPADAQQILDTLRTVYGINNDTNQTKNS